MSIIVRLKKHLNNFILDIDLQSESNRIGILGASGCGKSMTLKSIAGVFQPESGYIELKGKTLYDSARKLNFKPQQRRIGYLFQNYALFPNMTVEQNIMAGLHGGRKENRERAAEMIRKFQLTGLEQRIPAQLSGGQQQRTALARIMAYQPEVILLDEPFSALDAFLSDKLQQELLEMLKDYQGTVILVSHNRDEIYRFSDELLIMDQGRIITQGKTKEVFAHPKTTTAASLTGCKNIADIVNIDDHHYKVPDWGCTIYDGGGIPEEADSIGYRAHEFIPIWGKEHANCIQFRLKSMAELPFERKYFIQGENGAEICWFVQKDKWNELDKKGFPDYLQIIPGEILYLT